MAPVNENVGIALGLVAAAGASTGLGAAVVFFPSIVKLASRRVLASSLGFSAGVMTYVSFIEIFQKSELAFRDAGHDDNKAHVYAACCFFGGVIVMMILNVLVAVLLGGHGHRQEGGDGHDNSGAKKKKKKSSRKDVKSKNEDAFIPTCCNKDPVSQLANFQKMASVLAHEQEDKEGLDKYNRSETDMDVALDIDDDFVDNLPLEDNVSEVPGDDNAQVHEHDDEEGISEDKKATEENDKLVKMGMNTAIAIGLHNFPEGLATFVATLNDPKVGAVLAVAIAVHNIPEGLCVALPIFYATGNRRKAFLWALLSGASEFVAALLGWAVLANNFSYNSYAILFGLVAGMMVVISIRELLPTAHFYDPEDTVVTYSYICGMALIAFSLVLFKL